MRCTAGARASVTMTFTLTHRRMPKRAARTCRRPSPHRKSPSARARFAAAGRLSRADQVPRPAGLHQAALRPAHVQRPSPRHRRPRGHRE
eukprot:5848653-Pleurochrysis_carterae.AAC.1